MKKSKNNSIEVLKLRYNFTKTGLFAAIGTFFSSLMGYLTIPAEMSVYRDAVGWIWLPSMILILVFGAWFYDSYSKLIDYYNPEDTKMKKGKNE